MKCSACETTENFRYGPRAANEDGWICGCGEKPGEPPGYCPELDRANTTDKVSDLLHHLAGEWADAEYVCVSNGSHGAGIVEAVTAECQKQHRYDQLFILVQILDVNGASAHSDFWKKVNDGIVAGEDPRDRCACGKLATSWSNTGPPRCSSCVPEGDPF